MLPRKLRSMRLEHMLTIQSQSSVELVFTSIIAFGLLRLTVRSFYAGAIPLVSDQVAMSTLSERIHT